MARHEYHIAVKVEGENIHVAGLIGKRLDVPSTTLTFSPVRSDPVSYPVHVYWKSELPRDLTNRAAIEQAVLDYCGRLYQESPYEGPVDCCL
jgi:hypothetical protein